MNRNTPKSVKKPTALEIMKAVLFVLCDKEKKSDAVFIHASALKSEEEDNKILKIAAEMYKQKKTSFIVINGLTVEQLKKLKIPYPGYKAWTSKLIKLGVNKNKIIILPPSLNTPLETNNLLLETKKRKWKTLTIISLPHHQLRCFLQIIASIRKFNMRVKVYNKTHHLIDWRKIFTKQALKIRNKNNFKLAKNLRGTMFKHIEEEYDRILKYAQENGRHERNATISEMFDYVKSREN